MIASFQIVGVLKSADLKYSEKGKPYAELKVEVRRKLWNSYDDNSLLPMIMFGKGAEAAAVIPLESTVAVTGRLNEKRGEWNGKPYSKVQLIAENVEVGA